MPYTWEDVNKECRAPWIWDGYDEKGKPVNYRPGPGHENCVPTGGEPPYDWFCNCACHDLMRGIKDEIAWTDSD